MKRLHLVLAAVALAIPGASAAQPAGMPMPVPAAAPAEPGALPLYGDRTPGSTATERWANMGGTSMMVRNVTRPTLTPVLPDPAKATGAAVVVAPGGAFMGLSMDSEGWRVARALADRGIAAFVLKYRLVPTPADDAEVGRFIGEKMMREIGDPMHGELIRQSLAPTDARAALAMVRDGAARWHIDPARVGIIGFSAGAMTARRVAIDAPPAERPAFVGYIYGPQDAEPVPADAPPLFGAIAWDDPLFPGKGFAFESAWAAAKRPVELHVYQRGGHGFGMGAAGTTNALLVEEFTTWLRMQHFLDKTGK